MKKWIEILNEVKEDKSHGALWLALRSIDAFTCLAESLWGLRELERELNLLTEGFRSVRPSMASIRNATRLASEIVKHYVHESRPLNDVIEALLKLKDYIEKSKIEVAVKASQELSSLRVFLTHSLSSTVMELFRNLSGEKLVIVTESRPLREGVVMARRIASMGHRVKLIADASAYQASKIFGVEAFVFGVDTALKDGHVVNKVGTAQIAIALSDLGVKSIALCESIKVDEEAKAESLALEVKEPKELLEEVCEIEAFNLYFDVTPPKALYAIIMEDGVHKPPFNLRPFTGFVPP